MKASIDITPEQQKMLLALLRRFIPGVAVWAYGSRVKWTARPNSDLDLVAFTTPAQSHLVSELKDALGESNLPFLVDLHVWDEVPERFHEIIRKEYVVLQEAKQPESDSGIAGVRTVRLGNVCSKIGSGATPRGGKESYKGGATTLIRSQNIYNDGFHRDGLVFIDDNQSFELRNVEVQPNDVLLNITGDSVARCCQVADDVLPARVNQHVAIIRPKSSVLDARFLRYVLVSYDYQTRLLSLASAGATRPALTKAMIEGLDIPAPPLPEQKAIAHILGTLDDKIELNRRMNETLEAMARALFQSWFVDFDPVRAKLDGRSPVGLDDATAAFFPAHFQESSLGHIPQGWEVKTVGEIGNVVCGKTPSTTVSDYYGNDIPFITIPEMHGNVFAATTGRKLSHAGAASQANKTLPPGSICVSCIATPGLVVITSENSQTNQQINSVIPYETNETYFWYWVMTGLSAEIASSGSGGSVLTNLSKGRFETLQVITPPHALIRAYHSAVGPLFEMVLANSRQSCTLASLRDSLLPKLLSGEMNILRDQSELETIT